MGSRVSVERSLAVKRHKDIEKQLKLSAAEKNKVVKLLLLGAGESGKSTIVKQIRLIYLQGFNKNDLVWYRRLVRLNIFDAMIDILHGMEDLGLDFRHSERQQDRDELLSFYSNRSNGRITQITSDVFMRIRLLWRDDDVQSCFQRSNEFYVSDGAKYFLDNIDIIVSDGYIPSVQDILRCRVKTTGITEIRFPYKNLEFRLLDVGGQRSERKKWINCFEDVAALLFCVAMSEYNQTLIEDPNTNRMVESLRIFDSVVRNRCFDMTSIILFLNKMDLFEEKLKHHSLKSCFPDYSGAHNLETAANFIKEEFKKLNSSGSQKIFTHFTCATDTRDVQMVFDAVSSLIISQNLKLHGVLVT